MSETNTSGNLNSDPQKPANTLEVEDLNNLISVVKRREESLIQIIDFLHKPRKNKKTLISEAMAALQTQLLNLEIERKHKENNILRKYIGLKSDTERTKK